LNGRSDFLEKYTETAGELNDRGFDVLSFDWRGQGLSTRMLPHPRKGFVACFDDYLSDLDYFFEKIVRPNSPPPFIILAQSMGGLAALHHLHDHPLAIESAILVSPMIGICMPPAFRSITRTIAKSAVKLGWGHAFAPGAKRYSIKEKTFEKNKNTSDPDRFEFEIKSVRENPNLAVGGVTYQWLAAAFDSMDKLADDEYLREIQTPLLIVGAEFDSVVSIDAQKKLASKLSNCKYCVIPGARHEILMETDQLRSFFWRQFDRFIREEMHTSRKTD
jgi:lysophospholipase